MRREDLRLGQLVYLAELRLTPDATERILVHGLVVKLLGTRFYELSNDKRRIRNSWLGNMRTIDLLGGTPKEAVRNLEMYLHDDMDEYRKRFKQREREHSERRKLINDWFDKAGL